jgi:hypothetical protein
LVSWCSGATWSTSGSCVCRQSECACNAWVTGQCSEPARVVHDVRTIDSQHALVTPQASTVTKPGAAFWLLSSTRLGHGRFLHPITVLSDQSMWSALPVQLQHAAHVAGCAVAVRGTFDSSPRCYSCPACCLAEISATNEDNDKDTWHEGDDAAAVRGTALACRRCCWVCCRHPGPML